MSPTRGLPGFLRRSLRVDYDDDEGDDADENSIEASSDGDHTNDAIINNEDQLSDFEKNDTASETTAGSGNDPRDHHNHESRVSNRSLSDSFPPDSLPPPPPPTRSFQEIDERQQSSSEWQENEISNTALQQQKSQLGKKSPSSGGGGTARSRSKELDDDDWQQIPPHFTSPSPQPKLSYRETQFEKTLMQPDVVSLAELRKLGWNGIPVKYRALAWKMMLGYVPTNKARRAQTLQRKRSEYRDAMAQQHYHIDDDSRTLQEQETLRQVLVDVPRTAPEIPLFRNDRIKRMLTRLLYIWAMRHPASSYVQGINDLATPLIVVFLADYYDGQDVLDGDVMNHLSDERLDDLEADVYWCLTSLLAGIQDHYTSDQPGVQRMVMRLQELVNRIDVDLCRHLREMGIEFLQFSFKWMNCLLLREFHLRCVPRLWDTYISEKSGFEDFHVYVCAAFICQFSLQLQQMTFDELFAFFQDVPTSDWSDTEVEILLSQAFVLSTLFRGSEAHLNNPQNANDFR